MSNLGFFPAITANPTLSSIIWIILIFTALYLARTTEPPLFDVIQPDCAQQYAAYGQISQN